MFEAVYIADTNNNLVYEYLINLSSPSFKSLISVVSSLSADPNNIIEINKNYSVYKYTTSNIIIYTLNVANINPMLPFHFILQLIDVIHDYFGYPLAIPKIESNDDTLTLLISQMIDDGIPNITDFNQLRDIVPFSSFLSKLLGKTSQMTTNAIKKSTSTSISNLPRSQDLNTSSIPWRRSNVRHTNNEMYVDVVETVDVIFKSVAKSLGSAQQVKQFDSAFYSTNSSSTSSYSKSLVPVSSTINGQVLFTSRLTGVPCLQMILNVAGLNNINPKFHRCVKLDTWKQNNGTLSFIPPDGKFTLIKYSIDLDQFSRKDQLSMLGSVSVDYNYGLGLHKNEFEVKLQLPVIKGVTKIENLSIEINANYSNLITIKSSRLTHGDFSYKSNGKAEWNLRSVTPGVNPILYGSIITGDMETDSETFDSERTTQDKTFTKPVLKPAFIKLSYTNKGSLPSGIKVDSLKIVSAKGLSETVKPYKGVKYLTKTGDFIIRS